MVDFSLINTVYSTVTDTVEAMIPRLQDYGIWLTTGLGVIAFVFSIGQELLLGGDVRHFLVKLVMPGIKLSMIAWVIRDLPSLSHEFLNGFDIIAAKLTGAPGGSSAMDAAIGSVYQAADSIWNSMRVPSLWEDIKHFGVPGAAFELRLFVILGIILVGAIQASIFLISQVLSGIALALGPIFLPFRAIEMFSFLADGWLRFLIKASVAKLVGVVMLAICAAMASTLSAVATAAAQQDARNVDLGLTLIMFFVVIAELFLSLQTFSIAESLVSGSLSVSAPSPRGAMGAARKVGVALSNAAKPAGK